MGVNKPKHIWDAERDVCVVCHRSRDEIVARKLGCEPTRRHPRPVTLPRVRFLEKPDPEDEHA